MTPCHGIGHCRSSLVDPVSALQSLFAFVNDDPSPDRRHPPHTFRLSSASATSGLSVSRAADALCQLLSVDADQVEVDLPGHEVVRLKNISGKSYTYPINRSRGVFAINYRRRQGRLQNIGLFLGTQQGLGNLAPTDTPGLHPEFELQKQGAAGAAERPTAIGDTVPTPLSSLNVRHCLFVHLNVINNVLQNDYLRSSFRWYWVVFGWAAGDVADSVCA